MCGGVWLCGCVCVAVGLRVCGCVAVWLCVAAGVCGCVAVWLWLWQANLLRTQLHLEDTFYNLATSVGKPAVLLCDRGSMDIKACALRAMRGIGG